MQIKTKDCMNDKEYSLFNNTIKNHWLSINEDDSKNKNIQKASTYIKTNHINIDSLRNKLNKNREPFEKGFQNGINLKRNKLIIFLECILLISLIILIISSHAPLVKTSNIISIIILVINTINLIINIHQFHKNRQNYMTKSEYIKYSKFRNLINDVYSFQKTKEILTNMKK